MDLRQRPFRQGHVAEESLPQKRKQVRVLLNELKHCNSTRNLEMGKRIHADAMRSGNVSSIYVATALVNMYAKCRSMVDAQRVFDNIKCPNAVSWTALILGYTGNGEAMIALDLFARMRLEGCVPDSFTFVAALKASTSLALKQEGSRAASRERGKQLHSDIGCHLNIYVQNTLIDMYAKCGSMTEAREVFDGIKHPDVVSWNALILGYAENGDGVTALDLFERMSQQDCPPDCITFVAVLKTCGLLGALELGSKLQDKIHAEIDAGDERNATILVNCLVDFYAKCGSLVEAQKVFDSYPTRRNLITWTALLAGYSRSGDIDSVFGLFEEMQDAGFRPDGVTFLCLLSSCSHAGLVRKANEFFDTMSSNFGIAPSIGHYNCMIDLLCDSNLDDAMTVLWSMPCSPNAVTWTIILGACRKWKNVEIGKLAFESLVNLNDTNAAAYMLMAHIYGSAGMWEEQTMMLGMRKMFKAWKTSEESSWTSGAGEVHLFSVGDNKHPQIQEKVNDIVMVMKKHGYFISINHNAEEETLCGHTEILALACALINTEPGKAVRIVKNLGVCNDCHAAASLLSKLEDRIIFFNDIDRLHVFKHGKCSCIC